MGDIAGVLNIEIYKSPDSHSKFTPSWRGAAVAGPFCLKKKGKKIAPIEKEGAPERLFFE